MKCGLFLLSMICVSLSLEAETKAQDLTYLTEDYPPENYLEAGVLKGYAVETLKEIWKALKVPEQPIEVLPWARAYTHVQSNPNHMLFSMALTTEREKLFQWVGPIFQARYALICLTETNYPVKTLEDAKKYRVGVLNKDIGEDLLQEAKFPERSLEEVNTLTQVVKMLKLGRLDFICTTEASLKKLMGENPELNVSYKTQLVVQDIQVYYALSKGTDPALVKKLQQTLNSIDSQRRVILGRYGLVE